MPVWEKMLCCSQHQVPRCRLDSRGTIHLEMLKTWRLLTSAIRVMSCSLSSCSPPACCSTVVPLSDLCVRQMCVFATWGSEPTRPHRYRETQQLCPAENTFPNFRKIPNAFVMVWLWRHRTVLLWVAACPAAVTHSMDFCPTGLFRRHIPSLTYLVRHEKQDMFLWRRAVLRDFVPSDRSSCLEPQESF